MWIDDQVLKACSLPLAYEVWIPKAPMVVLGRGNKVEKELNIRACVDDGVPILKRLGGGGTVLLHSGCLIVSLGLWVKEFYANDRYFRFLNQSVIDCFNLELSNLAFDQRGHSDIVHGQLKIAGTSLFRSRNYLMYQASILVDMQIDWIEKYLAHPSLEPDYRKGRSHRDFLTDLGTLGQKDIQHWRKIFVENLASAVGKNFAGETMEPQAAQIPHVLSRIGEEWLKPEEVQAALTAEEQKLP